MSKNLFFNILLSGLLLLCSMVGFSQVTLTATTGTASGSFTTPKGAFHNINAGTHKGDIVIKFIPALVCRKSKNKI